MTRRRTPTQGAAGPDPADAPAAAAALSTAVSTFEMAQRNRVATGELLRAVLQGRAGGAAAPAASSPDADEVLLEVRDGRTPGPVPLLGSLYQRESALERECLKEMERLVVSHPTWPWLDRVRGVGPTLAARLLSRLRIERAATPSSFWRFCGLATIEGDTYRCASCGAVITVPHARAVPRRHQTPSGGACASPLEDARQPVRVAMRFPQRGERRSFDVTARTLCHLIGTSFLRRGGRYRETYDAQRRRHESQHPHHTKMHQHLSAMRAMEKLFLSHLWLVWAQQVGQTARAPYEVARRGRAATMLTPQDMME